MQEDLLRFSDLEEAGAGKFSSLIESVSVRQQALLDRIDELRLQYLRRFQAGLSGLNLRSVRAGSVRPPGVACVFGLESMDGIDMASTTASVRCDSASAGLREQDLESPVSVISRKFFSSGGVVEPAGDSWRVIRPEGAPEGVFLLELARPAVVNHAVFDVILSTPKASIRVEASLDGRTWIQASEISRQGYRIRAWMPGAMIRLLRLRMTPEHPDSPGDYSYSFGLTDVHVFSARYSLRSVLQFAPRIWRPQSTRVRFMAEAVEGVEYFLNLSVFSGPVPGGGDFAVVFPDGQAPGSYASVSPGQVLSLPGCVRKKEIRARVANAGPPDNPLYRLEYESAPGTWPFVLPSGLLWNSLLLLEHPSGRSVPLWPDMLPVASSVPDGFAEANMVLYWAGPADSGILQREWRLSYSTVPDAVSARLLVQISSRSQDRTPAVSGAWLEEVPEQAEN